MKKKFLSGLMALAIAIPCAFGLVGCGEDPADPTTPPATHTHSYAVCDEYLVVEDKAYHATKKCDCGDYEKTELADYIIATPETAQEILDGEINNKTVVFASGEYGTLKVRPTRETVDKIYVYDVANPAVYGAEKTLDEVKDTTTGSYYYVRELNNVKFVGAVGAEFKGVFSIQSKAYNVINYLNNAGIGLDAEDDFDIIRNIAVVDTNGNGEIVAEDIAYVDHITLESVMFEQMNFTGKKGRIFIGRTYDVKVENIAVMNCSFVTEEEWPTTSYSCSAVQLESQNITSEIKNIKIENCVIDGHYQGVRVGNANNVSIKNNTIKNSTHNLINIQGSYTKGGVLIEGNTLENGTDRAIRFYVLDNATVVIKDNTFVNASKSNGEILKAEASATGSSIELDGNTYGGVAITDATYTTEETPTIVVSKPA